MQPDGFEAQREKYEALKAEADRLEASVLERMKAIRASKAELAAIELYRRDHIARELRGARWMAENNIPRDQWDTVLDRFHKGPKVV